jgi:hypothetical protein
MGYRGSTSSLDESEDIENGQTVHKGLIQIIIHIDNIIFRSSPYKLNPKLYPKLNPKLNPKFIRNLRSGIATMDA